MKKLREVLLTQYIGAIAIGFMLAQTVTGVISGIVQTGVTYFSASHESSSVLGGPPVFPWKTLIFWLVTVILDLLVAFLLIKWLYFSDEADQNSSEEAAAGNPQP
jgi:hypothetical protein